MNYKMCHNCVLDTSILSVSLDVAGVCNYCNEYFRKEASFKNKANELAGLLKEIKSTKGKYDCIIGLSGGPDSSYTLYLLKKMGLNPLVVHCDMGWNTELATKNIELLLKKLKVDLYTYTIDWEEFKSVQLSYLKAGVIDLEMPTDHAFNAALYEVAAKMGIKNIISGHNFVTESIMPSDWMFNKGDAANMLDIYQKFGNGKKLLSFPVLDLKRKFVYYNIHKIKNTHLLNYLEYNKTEAIKTLQKEIGWLPHPLKHGESVFTRFYQCYILPLRFGVDKRKAHLSNLICSKQLSKTEALEELSKEIYPKDLFEHDRNYVLKKLQITEAQMHKFITQPIRGHEEFKTDEKIKATYNFVRNKFKLGLAISTRM